MSRWCRSRRSGPSIPILKNPANRHKAVGFTPEQFHYAFTNTLSREESDEVYERYHIPASGRLVWAGPLANFTPGHQENYVNFRNEDRAPLHFNGERDPPSGLSARLAWLSLLAEDMRPHRKAGAWSP